MRKVKRPVIGEMGFSFEIEGVDNKGGNPEVGKVGQYNVVKIEPGPIVGGLGVPGHPPNAHSTAYEVLQEVYIGKITEIKTVDKGDKTEIYATLSGINNGWGILAEKVDEGYRVGLIQFDPFEAPMERPYTPWYPVGKEIGYFTKTSEETLKKLLRTMRDSHLENLGINKKEIEKYSLPDGEIIYIE